MKKSTLKTLLILAIVSIGSTLWAQDYLVEFAIEGENYKPDSVQVKNVELQEMLTLEGSDILHLLGNVGISNPTDVTDELVLYPNPVVDIAHLEFSNQEKGVVTVTLYNISGKLVTQHSAIQPQGRLSYQLKGVPKGTYLVAVTNNQNETLSSTLLSLSENGSSPEIKQLSSTLITKNKTSTAAETAIIEMQYNDGENLIFTAYYNNQISLTGKVVDASHTIDFLFNEMIGDIEGNDYNTLQIGDQAWMAENLKTGTYKDGTTIPVIEDTYAWCVASTPAMCWYNNDKDYALSHTYGGLYNFFSVTTELLCPEGWHVPSNQEWRDLEFYLAATGHNYDGSIYTGNDPEEAGSKIGKAIADKESWDEATLGYDGATGDHPELNNSSAFNGIAAGGRYMLTGIFDAEGWLTNWWSSSPEEPDDAWNHFMWVEDPSIIETYYFKEGGYSIRCVKD